MYILKEWLDDFLYLKISEAEFTELLEKIGYRFVSTHNLKNKIDEFTCQDGVFRHRLSGVRLTSSALLGKPFAPYPFEVFERKRAMLPASEVFGFSYLLWETDSEEQANYQEIAGKIAQLLGLEVFQPPKQIMSQSVSLSDNQRIKTLLDTYKREKNLLVVKSDVVKNYEPIRKRLFLHDIYINDFPESLLAYVKLDCGESLNYLASLDLEGDTRKIYVFTGADELESPFCRALELWEEFSFCQYEVI